MNFIILIEFLLMTSQVSLGKIRNSSNDIYRLFTHLKYLLINPLKITNIDSPTSIFNELSVICEDHRSKTIDIFEILLTNYLLLFDTDEFHQIIVDEYSLANNQFLGSFFHLINNQDQQQSSSIFYRLLDQIHSSKRILQFLQNEFNDIPCRILLLIIFNILLTIEHFSILKLKKYETTFFSSLIVFLNKEFQQNKSTDNNDLTNKILLFLHKITEDLSTIPILININCPQSCLQWLEYPYLKNEEYQQILHILCNTARREEGIVLLRNLNSNESVLKFNRQILNKRLDYLIDGTLTKQMKFDITILNLLVTNTSDLDDEIAANFIRESLFPIIDENFLFILMKLFTNDRIINDILSTYSVSDLFSMISKVNSNELKANILWSISFQKLHQMNVIEHMKTINSIERDHSTYRSREIFSARRALDGIRENLFPSKLVTLPIPTKNTLVISHSHFDYESYRKFYDILSKTYQISVSNEIENWKQLADNLEQANVVVFLLSKEFFVDKSCRQEFIYSIDVLKKPCLGIYLDREYQISGWLVEHAERLKIIYSDEIENLFDYLREYFPRDDDKSDIKRWFIDQHLLIELYEFYQFQNRQELILYGRAISSHPWTQEYQRIRSRFERKFAQENRTLSAHEFSKFVTALGRLTSS